MPASCWRHDRMLLLGYSPVISTHASLWPVDQAFVIVAPTGVSALCFGILGGDFNHLASFQAARDTDRPLGRVRKP